MIDEEELRSRLTPEEFAILRRGGTERAFTGRFWNHHINGIYRCRACGAILFHSRAKYDSGTGWPSFHSPVSPDAVEERADHTLSPVRTEIVCSRCVSHLGHVFPDGPRPTGLRYCLNSACLSFEADAEGPI